MLIIHGTVHTMDGPAIDNGFVAIREGKIWKVGPMEECPADWKGRRWMPGGAHPAWLRGRPLPPGDVRGRHGL